MRVSARHDQREHRKMQLAISALAPLEQHGMNVPFKMVDGNQRLLERKSQCLGKADADKQSASQSWPLRDRDGIDGLISLSGFGQSLPHHWNNGAQMLARSQLRNDSSIRLMSGDLRSHNIRQNLLPRAHHRRACLITGGFDAEDVERQA